MPVPLTLRDICRLAPSGSHVLASLPRGTAGASLGKQASEDKMAAGPSCAERDVAAGEYACDTRGPDLEGGSG